MTELDPESQALLDHGRAGLGPDRDAVARIRRRVAISVGAVAVSGTAASAAPVKAVVAKLAIVAAIGGSVTTAVIVTRHRAVAATVPVIELAPEREIVDRAAQPHVDVVMREPPPPVLSPAVVSVAPTPQPPAPASAPVVEHASLVRETELVDAVTRAMRAGNVDDVRRIISTYERETAGTGQLAKELSAVEIEALCRAADPAASTKLAAFAQRWPRASQLQRLTAACKGSR